MHGYGTMHVGLGFFLNGRVLSNNSIVLLSDIGEGSSALYCLTDGVECCIAEAGANRGAWRYPDRSNVGAARTDAFYYIEGYSSISLNKRSSTTGPTGTYTCSLPNSTETTPRNLHIGIYANEAEGEIICMHKGFDF